MASVPSINSTTSSLATESLSISSGTILNHLAFTVYGRPQPQGSMTSFNGHLTSANPKLKAWRKNVATEAMLLRHPILDGPIALRVEFVFKRPVGAPRHRTTPTVKPDLDKLLRAIGDALTGVLIVDDAQIVEIRAIKGYGEPERAEIRLEVL